MYCEIETLHFERLITQLYTRSMVLFPRGQPRIGHSLEVFAMAAGDNLGLDVSRIDAEAICEYLGEFESMLHVLLGIARQ